MSPPPSPPTISIPCDDGYQLQGKLFQPTDGPPPRATVIVAPALLVRQRFYFRYARHLCSRGLRAITFANRGMGESLAAETRPWTHRLRHWGERDLPAVIRHARGLADGATPLFLVGHSMGGQVIGLSPTLHQLDGVITVAATSAYWGHWRAPVAQGIRLWYRTALLLTRLLSTFPADRLGLGPNTDSALVRDWVSWGLHPDYLAGPFGHDLHMADYRGRLLVYSFTDDAYGARAAVDDLHRHYRAAHVTRRQVDPRHLGISSLGHFGFYRKEGHRLWDEVEQWMEV